MQNTRRTPNFKCQLWFLIILKGKNNKTRLTEESVVQTQVIMQLAMFIPAFRFFVSQKIDSFAQISDSFREPTGAEKPVGSKFVGFLKVKHGNAPPCGQLGNLKMLKC